MTLRWSHRKSNGQKKKINLILIVYVAQSPTGQERFLCHGLMNTLFLWFNQRSFYHDSIATGPQTFTWQLSFAVMFWSSLSSEQGNNNHKNDLYASVRTWLLPVPALLSLGLHSSWKERRGGMSCPLCGEAGLSRKSASIHPSDAALRDKDREMKTKKHHFGTTPPPTGKASMVVFLWPDSRASKGSLLLYKPALFCRTWVPLPCFFLMTFLFFSF